MAKNRDRHKQAPEAGESDENVNLEAEESVKEEPAQEEQAPEAPKTEAPKDEIKFEKYKEYKVKCIKSDGNVKVGKVYNVSGVTASIMIKRGLAELV